MWSVPLSAPYLVSPTGPSRDEKRREGRIEAHCALPRQVVGVVSASVERNEEVGAAVAVGDGELGIPHLLAGRH